MAASVLWNLSHLFHPLISLRPFHYLISWNILCPFYSYFHSRPPLPPSGVSKASPLLWHAQPRAVHVRILQAGASDPLVNASQDSFASNWSAMLAQAFLFYFKYYTYWLPEENRDKELFEVRFLLYIYFFTFFFIIWELPGIFLFWRDGKNARG